MNHQSTAQNYIDYAVQFGVRSEQNGDRSGKADRHMKRKHLLPTMEAVQDPLARYRRHLEAEGKSINTIDSYCRTVNFFVRFMSSYRGRTFQPQHFSALNLALFLSYLRKVRGCQESTIRMRMSALASYGKFLVKIGLLTSNPVLMLRRAVKKSCSKRNQSDLNYQKLT
ncbi:MAG TPA: phage integrase N-terminal SAM-like domain-containing protein, partial [Syntrophomonadaceae bacterium]|nr:phage integrase N-terminal SAM-like domain-containing protein [Syntrophomonadaceae bacterium]